MTKKTACGNEIADLYGAYLIFRESDQGVEGFRKYMRQVFDPPDFDQTISKIIAEFARRAAGETQGDPLAARIPCRGQGLAIKPRLVASRRRNQTMNFTLFSDQPTHDFLAAIAAAGITVRGWQPNHYFNKRKTIATRSRPSAAGSTRATSNPVISVSPPMAMCTRLGRCADAR